MATVAKNAVGQYASFTSTGVVTLAGAALEGGRTFAAYADGTAGIPVMLQEMDGDGARGLPIAWEYCQCTYSSTAGTLTRGTIYASSNGGAPVNFSAGLKRAFVSLPAEDVVTQNDLSEKADTTAVAAAIADAVRIIDAKPSCKVAATENIDLSALAPLSYDGFTVAVGSRVLLHLQTAPTENGTYTINTFPFAPNLRLVRSPDEFTRRATVEIEYGSTYEGRKFILSADDPITVGTTPLIWELLPSAGGVTAYSALTGLPTLGTSAVLNVAASGNAAAGEVVKGNDTRLAASSIAIGANVAGATAGGILHTGGAGALAQAATKLFYDTANERLGLGTNAPTHLFHANKTGYTATSTPPGDICAILMENGETDSRKSKLSIAHAYNPAEVTDIYSFVVDSGYDTPSGAAYSQCSVGIGTLYGPARTGLFLKGLKLFFVNTGITFGEDSYPAANSLRLQLANDTTSTFYVQSTSGVNSASFSSANGLRVQCVYDTKTLFKSSAGIGGTELTSKETSDVALTLQMQASQTGDAINVKSNAGAVLAKVKASGAAEFLTLKLGIYTVATLPASPSVGDECLVNNALAPAWRGIVAAGGAELIAVRWTGTNWICTG